MKIFRKTFSEYLSFSWWVFYALFIIAIFRLLVGTAGLRTAFGERITSLTIASVILMVLLARNAYVVRFGSWRKMLVLAFIVSAFTQFIITMGILLYPIYGWPTYFHDPSPYAAYGHPMDPTIHILGHLTLGLVAQTAVLSIVGIATLGILTKISPRSEELMMGDSEFQLVAVQSPVDEEDGPAGEQAANSDEPARDDSVQ